jgi:hypothetical protein
MFRASLVHLQEALHKYSFGSPTSITTHNTHQNCFCVVPSEDGQVMPETYQGFKPNESESEGEVCIGLVVFITLL